MNDPAHPAAAPLEVAAPRSERSSGFLVACGIVLAAAGGLRLWHVLALRDLPLFHELLIDSRHYDQWAQRIAAGDWLGGDRTFFMDPGYPYALALLYRAFGRDLLLVHLFQVALGVGTCALVAWLGHRVGGRRVALLAAAFVALYGPLVFEEGEIEKTALGVFLVTAALAFATRTSIASRAAAGAFLAAGALTRGNLLLLVPFGAALFFLERRRDPSASGEGLGRGRRALVRLRAPLAFAAGFLLVTSPVLLRNHRVSGEWVLTTAHFGQNLYAGNNPVNVTGAYTPLPFVRPNPAFEELDFAARAEATTGRKMAPAEVSRFWVRQTLAHVAEHPGFAAKMFAKKAVLTFSDWEVPDGWSPYFLRRFSPALRLAFLGFAWLLPLAAVGAIATFGGRASRVLSGYAAVYAASLVAFFVLSRYRIFLAPALAVLAAAGAAWLHDAARAGRFRLVAAAAVACAAIAAGSVAGTRITGLPEAWVDCYANLAALYQAAGDVPRAEAVLREGLRESPRAASIRYGLASLRLGAGDGRAALVELEAAAAADPDFPNLWYAIGFAHEELNDLVQASACYARQLERTPGHEGALARLAALRARLPARIAR